MAYTTIDPEVAASCFYSKPVNGKLITGASIRFAEIVLASWGNIRAKSVIVGNDNKYVTAEAVIWDLQKNTAVSQQVKRRICYKDGNTYSDDLIITNSNAACSIVLRNVVFKLIPVAILKSIHDEIKKIVGGEGEKFIEKRDAAIKYFNDLKVDTIHILKTLQKNSVKDLTGDDVFTLRKIYTAIVDKETTIEDAFGLSPASKNNATSKIHSKLGNAPPTDSKTVDDGAKDQSLIVKERLIEVPQKQIVKEEKEEIKSPVTEPKKITDKKPFKFKKNSNFVSPDQNKTFETE
jgi:hypothetical protein